MIANYTEAHNPRSSDCPHNQNPEQPCTCKPVRNRKPFRVVKVNDRSVSHGIRPQLTVNIWPDGRIEIREHKRRHSICVTVGVVYERALMAQARQEILTKRAARKAKRLARRR